MTSECNCGRPTRDEAYASELLALADAWEARTNVPNLSFLSGLYSAAHDLRALVHELQEDA